MNILLLSPVDKADNMDMGKDSGHEKGSNRDPPTNIEYKDDVNYKQGIDESESWDFQPQVFEFAVQGVSITAVSILGLCANCICLLVMSRPSLKKGQCSSINALLTSMAAVDIIVLVCR